MVFPGKKLSGNGDPGSRVLEPFPKMWEKKREPRSSYGELQTKGKGRLQQISETEIIKRQRSCEDAEMSVAIASFERSSLQEGRQG